MRHKVTWREEKQCSVMILDVEVMRRRSKHSFSHVVSVCEWLSVLPRLPITPAVIHTAVVPDARSLIWLLGCLLFMLHRALCFRNACSAFKRKKYVCFVTVCTTVLISNWKKCRSGTPRPYWEQAGMKEQGYGNSKPTLPADQQVRTLSYSRGSKGGWRISRQVNWAVI